MTRTHVPSLAAKRPRLSRHTMHKPPFGDSNPCYEPDSTARTQKVLITCNDQRIWTSLRPWPGYQQLKCFAWLSTAKTCQNARFGCKGFSGSKTQRQTPVLFRIETLVRIEPSTCQYHPMLSTSYPVMIHRYTSWACTTFRQWVERLINKLLQTIICNVPPGVSEKATENIVRQLHLALRIVHARVPLITPSETRVKIIANTTIVAAIE